MYPPVGDSPESRNRRTPDTFICFNARVNRKLRVDDLDTIVMCPRQKDYDGISLDMDYSYDSF